MTIIEQIDNAISDWSVSGDAMRWTPEVPVEPVHPKPILRLNIDVDAVVESFAAAGRALEKLGATLARSVLFPTAPTRPDRISAMRRTYRAKRRHW